MNGAKCYQPTKSEVYPISDSSDLFIKLPNGKSIRMHIENDCIKIYQGNRTIITLCNLLNMPGVKITGS
jgi:hypothetical protein